MIVSLRTHGTHRAVRANHVSFDARIRLDADAQRAYRAFRDNVWLVCRNAPHALRQRGDAATATYMAALQAYPSTSRDAIWRTFVATLWRLLAALDAYPAPASLRAREARGALCRVVVDNLDLIEPRAAQRERDRAVDIHR